MSTVNLDALLDPSSVALVGASRTKGSVGAVLAKNMLRSGFHGPVLPVHREVTSLEGVLAYPDVASLPLAPDLAVIATPPETVPSLIGQLGNRGTRAAVVISAGFSELGERGQALQQEMLEAARPHLLRVVGPNCLGVQVPGIGLNATFAHITPPAGGLAFLSQSGAIITSVLDWAQPRGIGFSHLLSLGAMADVDFGDVLDHLAADPATTAILLYVEGIQHARKFLSAARIAARMKPVIVIKAGRDVEGARAVASHTGALAGSDRVYEAAFRRVGLLRVRTLEQLFSVVGTLAMTKPPHGDRLAIVTNGGGMGVLATDELAAAGGRLAELSEETVSRLGEVLPPTWSKANPVDIIGDAGPERYAKSVRLVRDDPGVDALLVLNCPTGIASSADAARSVIEVTREAPRPPLFASWVGGPANAEASQLFSEAKIPSYDTPGEAVHTFLSLLQYRNSQKLLMETPPSVPEEFSPDVDSVHERVQRALREGREWLSPAESVEILRAYGMPCVRTEVASSPEEAATVAASMGAPVALKLLSRDVTHKSDVGGVALELEGREAVLDAAKTMAERVRSLQPTVHIDGFILQPMVRRRGVTELIIGASEDPVFGPVLLFGRGGTDVEVIADRAVGLPPLNMRLARELISRTRVSRRLSGARGRKSVDLDALALGLIRVAQLLVDVPEILELDANPVLADADGILVVDARVRVGVQAKADRLAIRPYPTELEQWIETADGERFFLRPMRAEDEPSLQRAYEELTPEEIRMRFFTAWKRLSHNLAARLTQLDYGREMAFVLTEPGIAGQTEVYAVVRLHADANNERGEFAIIVRHELTGKGLGRKLMEVIIEYARARGLRTLWGDVLAENRPMLALARRLGFRQTRDAEEPSIVRVTLPLDS